MWLYLFSMQNKSHSAEAFQRSTSNSNWARISHFRWLDPRIGEMRIPPSDPHHQTALLFFKFPFQLIYITIASHFKLPIRIISGSAKLAEIWNDNKSRTTWRWGPIFSKIIDDVFKQLLKQDDWTSQKSLRL